MTHFACISVAAHGHINPMAALARELVARGHRVTFLHALDVEPMVRRHGLDFVPVGMATHPIGRLEVASRDAGRVTGFVGIRRLIGYFAEGTAMLCRELPDALRGLDVDLILTDQLEPAGGLVAYHLKIPFISIAAALPVNWEEGIPSPFVGWNYGESGFHRTRNVMSAFVAKKAMTPIGDVLESVSREWGIDRGRQVEDYASGWAQISQLTRSLDFPRNALSRCFHYCGPLRSHTPSARDAARPPGARRAFVSLGTLQGHRAELFTDIAIAVRNNGLDVTIAHGGRLSPDDVALLSRVADVHDFVDQNAILETVDIAVLHGGLNTVLDSLEHGVPMVLVPLAYEQAAIASRVLRSGTGLVCKGRALRRQRIARAIHTIGADSGFARAAATLGTEIRAAGGTRRAADIVEQVATTRKPVLSS